MKELGCHRFFWVRPFIVSSVDGNWASGQVSGKRMRDCQGRHLIVSFCYGDWHCWHWLYSEGSRGKSSQLEFLKESGPVFLSDLLKEERELVFRAAIEGCVSVEDNTCLSITGEWGSWIDRKDLRPLS